MLITTHKDMSNEDYHASMGLSNSGVTEILYDPEVYYYKYLSGMYDREESSQMKIGTAIHCAVLEPQRFIETYRQIPSDIKVRKGKKWDKILDDNPGKIFIKQKEYANAINIKNKLSYSLIFQETFDPCNVEHSIFFTYDDIYLKSRPDYYNDKYVVDIKKTKSIKYDSFSNSIYTYNYHSQAAMQIDALKCVDGKDRIHLFLAIEENPPHLFKFYQLDNQAIALGRERYQIAAYIYDKCTETNIWSNQEDEIDIINLPSWILKKDNMI
jgi:hypothetical protein